MIRLGVTNGWVNGFVMQTDFTTQENNDDKLRKIKVTWKH